MRDVTGLFVVLLTSLLGGVGGIKPSSGYCIGNQCFSVFQDPNEYKTAQSLCEDQGGHLMTVRSTVAHDTLVILLGNLSGQFWIGLHLSAGCPDAAAELKGYEWVTKDSESDFSNWAPQFDSSCSAHRCVSVSRDSDFKWKQEPCDEQAAGVLCEYALNQPCKRLAVTEGESVIYTTPLGFGGEDVLSLPLGSTAIRMPAETKYVCFSEKWLKAPWTCEILQGGCEHDCIMDPDNEPSCFCPPGQIINPDNKITCEAAESTDPCLPLRCAHACYQEGDSYACTCDHGFKLAADGRSCVDFNDCKDERQCPGDNFKCVNTVGGFQCVCKDGYKLRGDACVDVDECAAAPCEHMCTNTPGSYACSCYDGYKEDAASPNKCKLHCGKEECLADCDPNDKTQCYCPEGYVAEERTTGTVCIDMDECISFFCDQGCKNTFGSYVCSCSPGYTLVDSWKCVRNDDDTDLDGGIDGSGATTPSDALFTSPEPNPGPTRQPSAVTVGALVGIIVCTVFFVLLLVYLAHRVLCNRGKMESAGALKASEDEAHRLEHVNSDT